MYHPRLRGSHYQIGYQVGTFLKNKRINFDALIHLDPFQQQFGRQSQEILKEVFPEVCDEIRSEINFCGYR